MKWLFHIAYILTTIHHFTSSFSRYPTVFLVLDKKQPNHIYAHTHKRNNNYKPTALKRSKEEEEIQEDARTDKEIVANTGHEDDADIQNRNKERAMLALGSIGLTRDEANVFLTNYPQLHTHTENLTLRILYFQNEMGIRKEKLYQMITKQPGLTATSFLDDELKSTIEVLQSELNLTTDEVWKLATKSFPQIMRYNRSDLKRKLNFYRSELKLTEKELKRLVVIQPEVLRHLPSELKETMDTFQQELDCDTNDFKAMILKFPLLLAYNTQSKLLPCIKFVKQSEIGIGLGLIRRAGDPSTTSLTTNIQKEALIKKRVKTVLLQYPNLLAFSIDNNLKPTLKFLLQDVGLSTLRIGKVIWRFPEVLGLSIEKNLRPKIHFLTKSLNITSVTSLANLIVRDPRILGFNMLQNFPDKMNFFLEELDFTRDELRAFFTKRPQILTLSIPLNIKPKVDYYRNECGLTRQELKQWILENPAELTFNLETRIKPRMAILKKNNARLLEQTPWNIISKSEKRFLLWVKEYSST